jgi:hypothetical protein
METCTGSGIAGWGTVRGVACGGTGTVFSGDARTSSAIVIRRSATPPIGSGSGLASGPASVGGRGGDSGPEAGGLRCGSLAGTGTGSGEVTEAIQRLTDSSTSGGTPLAAGVRSCAPEGAELSEVPSLPSFGGTPSAGCRSDGTASVDGDPLMPDTAAIESDRTVSVMLGLGEGAMCVGTSSKRFSDGREGVCAGFTDGMPGGDGGVGAEASTTSSWRVNDSQPELAPSSDPTAEGPCMPSGDELREGEGEGEGAVAGDSPTWIPLWRINRSK